MNKQQEQRIQSREIERIQKLRSGKRTCVDCVYYTKEKCQKDSYVTFDKFKTNMAEVCSYFKKNKTEE